MVLLLALVVTSAGDSFNGGIGDPEPGQLEPGQLEPGQTEPTEEPVEQDPDDPESADVYFDAWPDLVSDPPAIMPPQIPWPSQPHHDVFPGDPYPSQHFEAPLPRDPDDPEREVTVVKDEDGDVTIVFEDLVGSDENQIVISETTFEITGSDVEAISVWLGFTDWDGDGEIDDGDVVEVIVSIAPDGWSRIDYHFCMGADGIWSEC
ncbi:MAG: hypothetical protein JXB13_20600 [Phycisphaerae bacterium]|nr:hypothetical protein [Phycisphaerae bacterium]